MALPLGDRFHVNAGAICLSARCSSSTLLAGVLEIALRILALAAPASFCAGTAEQGRGE
jgi:hypothetical protein